MYGQNNEDDKVVEYFSGKTDGKFIDIGAFHIETFSNTRALYLNGWKGIMVEPAPINWKAIADHYANDSEMVVLNVAIGDNNGEIDFYDSGGDAVGSSALSHTSKWEAAGVKYTKIKVQQVGVVEFMEKYARDCDMLSLDTESSNMSIFRLIPDWVWERLVLAVIEHDGSYKEINKKLSSFGFKQLLINSENVILGK